MSEPFTVSVYGKGCCGDHDVHSWEEAVREAASSMMNLTNRVAKVVSLHKANLVELIGTLDSKVKFAADEGGEWWQRQGVQIYTEVGPVRVITTKDIPRMAAFVASQDDIDEYVDSMKWIRATKVDPVISRADRATLEELMSKIEGETEPYIFTDVGPTELKGLAAWLPEPGSTPPPEYLALGQLLRSLDPITDKMLAGTITKREAKRARKLLRKAMKDVTG